LCRPLTVSAVGDAVTTAWQWFLDRHSLLHRIETLERELADRKVIERAKGILMQRLALSEADAMRHLQKKARDTRRPMADLARTLIDAQVLVED